MDQDHSEPSSLVSLLERRQKRRHPALVQVEGYWESLRGDRLVPDRSEVDPRGLTGALENAFVLERIAPGLARFRVAGMHLSDLMGLEVRGMPISAVFTPDTRPKLSTALEATFSEPAQVWMRLEGEDGIGRAPLKGEMLILPLRSDGGEVTRALGCIVMDGAIGRQPRRLRISEMQHKTLVGFANPDDEAPSAAPTPEPSAPRAKASDLPVGDRPPYLRLVHSVD